MEWTQISGSRSLEWELSCVVHPPLRVLFFPQGSSRWNSRWWQFHSFHKQIFKLLQAHVHRLWWWPNAASGGAGETSGTRPSDTSAAFFTPGPETSPAGLQEEPGGLWGPWGVPDSFLPSSSLSSWVLNYPMYIFIYYGTESSSLFNLLFNRKQVFLQAWEDAWVSWEGYIKILLQHPWNEIFFFNVDITSIVFFKTFILYWIIAD